MTDSLTDIREQCPYALDDPMRGAWLQGAIAATKYAENLIQANIELQKARVKR